MSRKNFKRIENIKKHTSVMIFLILFINLNCIPIDRRILVALMNALPVNRSSRYYLNFSSPPTQQHFLITLCVVSTSPPRTKKKLIEKFPPGRFVWLRQTACRQLWRLKTTEFLQTSCTCYVTEPQNPTPSLYAGLCNFTAMDSSPSKNRTQ